MITKINARELARSILLDCGGDRNRAFERMQRESKANPEVEAAIRDAIPLATLIRDLLGDAGHGIRQQSIRMANAEAGKYSPSQAASMLYNTPLWNGTPARLAKRADWENHVQHYVSTIRGMRLEVAYARKVLQHLRDVLTETQEALTPDALLELREEAGREVGQ